MSWWWKEYDERGKLMYEGNYSNGIKEGYNKTYKNGIIQSEGKYTNGRLSGSWKYYDENGKMIRIQNYEDYD